MIDKVVIFYIEDTKVEDKEILSENAFNLQMKVRCGFLKFNISQDLFPKKKSTKSACKMQGLQNVLQGWKKPRCLQGARLQGLQVYKVTRIAKYSD